MAQIKNINDIKEKSFYRRSIPTIEDGKFAHIIYVDKILDGKVEDFDYNLSILLVYLYTDNMEFVRKETYPKVIFERFINNDQVFDTELSEDKKAKVLLEL